MSSIFSKIFSIEWKKNHGKNEINRQFKIKGVTYSITIYPSLDNKTYISNIKVFKVNDKSLLGKYIGSLLNYDLQVQDPISNNAIKHEIKTIAYFDGATRFDKSKPIFTDASRYSDIDKLEIQISIRSIELNK